MVIAMDDNGYMMNFFNNLDSIAQHLCCAVERGEPLPLGAAEAVSKFNDVIASLEVISQDIRRKNITK